MVGSGNGQEGQPVPLPAFAYPRSKVCTSVDNGRLLLPLTDPPWLCTVFSFSKADSDPSLAESGTLAAGRGEEVVDHDLPCDPASARINSACTKVSNFRRLNNSEQMLKIPKLTHWLITTKAKSCAQGKHKMQVTLK
jgi:hypothetical protein